ncbi:MAG: hypothetical protein AAFP77_28025 [Bacteroidota bacterium]
MKEFSGLRLFLGLLLLVLVSQTSMAQLGRGLQPSWTHLDKAFYLAGEPLGFQLYLAPEFAEEDILVQSILFTANGEAVLYNYWSQAEVHVHGQFQLPQSLSTAWYYLSFRTWDVERKTERVLHQVPLAIYNDEAEIAPEEVSQREPTRETAEVQIPVKELQIQIGTLPENLSPGEATNLQIQVTDRRGRPVEATCSVSITDWELLSTSLAMGMDNLQASDSLLVVTPDRLSSRFFWQGGLVGSDGQLLAETPFRIANAADRQELSTDVRGRFVFQSRQQSARELIVTLPDAQEAKVRFQPAPGRLALGRLFYSPAAFRYLEINRQRKAIWESLSQYSPASIGPTNLVESFESQIPLTMTLEEGQHGWRDDDGSSFGARPSQWYPALTTGTDGGLTIDFKPNWEVRAYRIDVVAQDENGQRGRTTVVYRMPTGK